MQTNAAAILPGTAGRATARKQARARKARRRRLLAATVLSLLALGLVGWWVADRQGGSSGATGTDGAARTQRTTLLQLKGADGVAVASVLLASDPRSKDGAAVLLPSRLLVDVPGYGSTDFGEAVRLPDPSAAAHGLSDLIGVTVDSSWILDQQAFAALVDAVGKVKVTAPADVTQSATDGSSTVVLPAGSHELDGASAALYVSTLAASEPEQARLARFSQVLEAIVQKLPTSATASQQLLSRLGPGSVLTASPHDLAQVLDGLRASEDRNQVRYQTLPTRTIDTGAAAPSYSLDAAATTSLVQSVLSDSVPPDRPGGPVRVLIQNGNGAPGLGETARSKLVGAGFRYINGGNADRFGYDTSVIIIKDSTSKARAQGTDVAATLGLPASAVQLASQGQSVADVIVILGGDYHP